MDVNAYIKETKAEMKHVSWPSRKEVTVFTAAVIGVSLATAVSLGFFDFVFSRSLGALFVGKPLFQNEIQSTTIPSDVGADLFNPQLLPTTETGPLPDASAPTDVSEGLQQ